MSVVADFVADGFSIPFFSFGRRIHSRTVSISRTWTSRTTAVPEWLLGTRRMPEAMPSINGFPVLPDIEPGIPSTTVAETIGVIQVDPQEEFEAERSRPAADRADSISGLRRRFPSPDATRQSSPAPSELVRIMVSWRAPSLTLPVVPPLRPTRRG